MDSSDFEDEYSRPVNNSIDVRCIDQDSEANDISSQYRDSEIDSHEFPDIIDVDLWIEDFVEENVYLDSNIINQGKRKSLNGLNAEWAYGVKSKFGIVRLNSSCSSVTDKNLLY